MDGLIFKVTIFIVVAIHIVETATEESIALTMLIIPW